MEDPELASLQTVFETLRLASCQDPTVLKPAEEKLKEWEIVPGYYTILMKIILKHDIDLNVRWLAFVFEERVLTGIWRRNITNGINDAERMYYAKVSCATFASRFCRLPHKWLSLWQRSPDWTTLCEWPS
ncbi:hypothetical protein LSTR_LSTR002892 [Laodelphax striatellus]|uniref:Importin N-terminal domain-containing protein n=1 Tax=Laodelphax striatellus TaxID=195883 RepID=A0A482XZZ2_LAOST|nr:hypothetical protein LSTR_LSTR002892 [Laodelphax striatellus]